MVVLLIASTVAWLALEAWCARPELPPRDVRALRGARAGGLALLAVHVAGLVEHALRGGGEPAGLILIAGGVALRIAAIRRLGSDFVSTASRPARLVTTGLYRWMNHPSEVGMIAAAAGAAVLLGSAAAGAMVVLAVVPLSLARCAAEDRVLQRT